MLSAMRIQRKYFILALLLLLPVCLVLALTFGAVSLSLRDVLHVLFSSDLDSRFDSADIIINQIRLPRILLTAIVGGLLAISGAAMQGLFRNPLADPSLIGVTAGASVGASIVIVFGGAWLGTIWGLSLLSVGAFIGGVVTVLLVYRLATGVGGTSVATMLLAGIAITALAGGIGGLLQFMADNEMLRRISLWSMGGLGAANYLHLITAAIVALFVFVLLPRDSMALNAMLLGESEARHLGINVEAVKTRLIILVAAGVGTSVALAGSIAFVGLVVPHIVRMLIGPDHRYLLPASTLAGAILLVLADIVARTLISPTELPVGLVTAFIGAPFFISLLRRRHIYGMQ